MKKLCVSHEKCIGCGACISIDPDHFDFSDEGYSEVIKEDNLDTEELQTAIESCPTSAISLGCNCDENCKCGCQEGKECTCEHECK